MAVEAMPSSALFGIEVDALTREQAVERCLQAVRTATPLEVGVVNAAKVVKMRENPDLARSVSNCGLILVFLASECSTLLPIE